MKKAVMYGAGNIGRGFIGKVFADSGYEVCFLDIDEKIIGAFNRERHYGVRIVSDDFFRLDVVENVYAVSANTQEAIAEIANCDIMATAVGVHALPHIIHTIANGIKMRIALDKGPLDIILAENQLDVDQIMRRMIYDKLNICEQNWADRHLGLVEASIGRMIPPLPKEEREEDPLLIAVEPYAELPVDALGFRGGIPDLAGLKPFTPFSFYVKRKLFLHNMGHALCAYLGWQKRYRYIYEAIRDPLIFEETRRAMEAVVTALAKEYPQIPYAAIEANKADILSRFHNKALMDQITRVANDPMRKLRTNDRLIGSALYCLHSGVRPDSIVNGIVAALCYDNDKDARAMELQSMLKQKGLEYVLREVLQIPDDSGLTTIIIDVW